MTSSVRPFDGDLDDYAKLTLTSRKPGSKPVNFDIAPAAAPPSPRDFAKLQKSADAAEKRMADINGKIATLDRALAVPGLFEKEPGKAARYAKERGVLAMDLEKAETEWLDASAALEAAGVEN